MLGQYILDQMRNESCLGNYFSDGIRNAVSQQVKKMRTPNLDICFGPKNLMVFHYFIFGAKVDSFDYRYRHQHRYLYFLYQL